MLDDHIIQGLKAADKPKKYADGVTKIADAEGLKKILATVKEETVSLNRFKIWKGRLKNGKKAV